MKIERKYVAHYINAGDATEPIYVRLGKDLEEFTPELSADVEKSRNILGQSRVIISGYDKSAAVEPYYAEMNTPLFAMLQGIIDKNAVLEDLRTDVVDVKLWEGHTGDSYPAIREEAYIEITSYGGDHKGYRIGFSLHFTGIKTDGMFDVSTNTFTEGQQ